jgi:hypothetical protein
MNVKHCQLEMPLEPSTPCTRTPSRRRRTTRARWWFQQMRLAVDRAREYDPGRVATLDPSAATAGQGHALDSSL